MSTATATATSAAAGAGGSNLQRKDTLSFREIMDKSAKSAVRGGTAGAAAMGANVAALMWMRTTVSNVVVLLSCFHRLVRVLGHLDLIVTLFPSLLRICTHFATT